MCQASTSCSKCGEAGRKFYSRGVSGYSTENVGVYGESYNGVAVHGHSNSGRTTGVFGDSFVGWGVHGSSSANTGVLGVSLRTSPFQRSTKFVLTSVTKGRC